MFELDAGMSITTGTRTVLRPYIVLMVDGGIIEGANLCIEGEIIVERHPGDLTYVIGSFESAELNDFYDNDNYTGMYVLPIGVEFELVYDSPARWKPPSRPVHGIPSCPKCSATNQSLNVRAAEPWRRRFSTPVSPSSPRFSSASLFVLSFLLTASLPPPLFAPVSAARFAPGATFAPFPRRYISFYLATRFPAPPFCSDPSTWIPLSEMFGY